MGITISCLIGFNSGWDNAVVVIANKFYNALYINIQHQNLLFTICRIFLYTWFYDRLHTGTVMNFTCSFSRAWNKRASYTKINPSSATSIRFYCPFATVLQLKITSAFSYSSFWLSHFNLYFNATADET